MIVGFATRGQGRGAGPVGYCVKTTVTQAKKRTETRDPPPTVLRGDPDATERLIDSLSFKYRYKSGVLSFAPGEVVTPEMERDIMDRFEAVAFAGLGRDQYNILWVRHTHAGHHEIHFVTPRVELTTGKSLNICPPGRGARAAFDDFRSMINSEYGLADPDDPTRERDIQHPKGDRKMVQFEGLGLDGLSEAKRRIELRDLAHSMIAKRIEAGLIRDRASLLDQVQEIGFSVTRSSKNSITLLHPDDPDATRFKMKGAVYESGWKLEATLERSNEKGERDFTGRDKRAAERYAGRVEEHIQRRADYNRSRYAPRNEAPSEAFPALDAVAKPSPGDDLSRYIIRGLGIYAIPVRSDRGASADVEQPEDAGLGASTAGRRQGVSVTAGRGDVEQAETDQQWSELRTVEQVKNERIRANITERVRAIRTAADRAAKGARHCIERTRACLQRVRAVEPASPHLAAAVGRFERIVLDHEAQQRAETSAARSRLSTLAPSQFPYPTESPTPPRFPPDFSISDTDIKY